MGSKTKSSHLRALLRKNWISWKRGICVSLCEILIPLLFTLILFVFRNSSKPEDIPQTTFFNNPQQIFDADGTLSTLALGQYMKDCNARENGGKVALAPQTDSIILDLNTAFKNAGFETMLFPNNEAINTYTSDIGYAQTPDFRLCFGVIMTKHEADQYEYLIRMNSTEFGDSDIPSTSSERVKKIAWENLGTFQEYRDNGFLLIQNFVDNTIMQKDADINNPNLRIKTQVTSRTLEAYGKDNFADGLKGQTRMFIDMPLLFPLLRFMNGILREKEKKIREGMKIMGLNNSAFYLSWFITYFIIFTIISILVSIVLATQLFSSSSFFLIFLWYWEFCLCLMALGFFITVFFNKAKSGNVAGFVIALFLGFIQTALSSSTNSMAYFMASFAPQASVGISADHMLTLESVQLGLSTDTINLKVKGYQMSFHFIVMILDIFIFVLLGAYLDQVLPSEFGLKKHPLFCLKRKKKAQRKGNPALYENLLQLVGADNSNFEGVDPTLKAQDEANQSIQVQGLRKVYDGGKVAVQNVSFNMYKSQIFSLLGHNGAGKTTTISMITGLFAPTEGTTKIFGYDVQEDQDEVRKIMGVCPQHDILFDNLTVKEHLELFAVFKGVDTEDIPDEVEKIIRDIGLDDKRDYLSKNLSGGQKRKLSIGIAFIGGSKFILLDEPSSGMDTSARRKMWDMLKNYKHNRIVLLTTHFMDEADYLGDRIGIMADGQLKCLGSSLFLKTKFGVGYSLTMVKQDINDPSQPIKDFVSSHVPEGKVLSDVSAEIIIQLPLKATSKFRKLFNELDKSLEKLKISSYGISVTTLEEVFLNVAKITAPDKHFQNSVDTEENSSSGKLDDYDIREHRIRGAWANFWTHFAALVKKRVQYFRRDKRGLICEVLMPILLIIGGIVLVKSSFGKEIQIVSLTDNIYDYQYRVNYNTFSPLGQPLPDYKAGFTSSDMQLFATTVNDLPTFDKLVMNTQGMDLTTSPINIFSVFVSEYDTTNSVYKYTAFIDTRAQEGSAFAANKINNALFRTITGKKSKTISTVIAPFHDTKGTLAIQTAISGIMYAFIFAIGMSFIPASLITFIVKEREVNAKHQQMVSGVSLTAYWFSNFFVDYLKYLIPAVINALLAIVLDASALVDGDKLGACWAIFLLYGASIIPFVYLMGFMFRDYGSAQIVSFFFNFGTGFIGGMALSVMRLIDSTRNIAKIFQWFLRILPTFSMTYGFLNLANREAFAIGDGGLTPVFSVNSAGGDVMYLALTSVGFLGLVFLVEKLRNRVSVTSIISKENRIPYIPKKYDSDVEREIKEIENSDNSTYTIKVDKLRKVYNLGKGKHKIAVDRLSFGVKNGECFALLGVNGAGKTTTFKILSGDYVQTSGQAYINGYQIPEEIAEARQNIGYCPQFDSILELLTAKEHLEMYAAIKGIPKDMRPKIVEKHLREMNLKQYENIPAGTYSGGNKRKLCVAIAMIGNPAVVFLDEPSTGMDPEARRFMWNVISRISRERKQSSIILTTHSMEEAEALATKMGIMVNGGLKCLGTSQHIKSKYGGGYEVEVKLNSPSKESISVLLEQLQMKYDDTVTTETLNSILEKLDASHLIDELNETGTGSAVFTDLSTGSTSINMVVEWVLTEKSGEVLKDFLYKGFGEMIILEHFQTFYRFKTKNDLSVGYFFGAVEANKEVLNILQYSIKQTTIEQIFNAFATEDEKQQAPPLEMVAMNIRS